MDPSQEQPQQQAADMAAPPADEIAAAMAAQMDPAMAAYEEGNPSDPSSHSRKKASQAAWRNSEHGKAYMKAYRSTPEAKQRDNMRKKMKRQSMKYGKDRDKRIIVAAEQIIGQKDTQIRDLRSQILQSNKPGMTESKFEELTDEAKVEMREMLGNFAGEPNSDIRSRLLRAILAVKVPGGMQDPPPTSAISLDYLLETMEQAEGLGAPSGADLGLDDEEEAIALAAQEADEAEQAGAAAAAPPGSEAEAALAQQQQQIQLEAQQQAQLQQQQYLAEQQAAAAAAGGEQQQQQITVAQLAAALGCTEEQVNALTPEQQQQYVIAYQQQVYQAQLLQQQEMQALAEQQQAQQVAAGQQGQSIEEQQQLAMAQAMAGQQ